MTKIAHTAGSCGCRLEPVNDTTEACDLCSEATGTHNGIGWRITFCAIHKAAPHDCDIPDCPGRENQHKLQAFDGLVEALNLACKYLAKAVADGLMKDCVRPPLFALEKARAAIAAAKKRDPVSSLV